MLKKLFDRDNEKFNFQSVKIIDRSLSIISVLKQFGNILKKKIPKHERIEQKGRHYQTIRHKSKQML